MQLLREWILRLWGTLGGGRRDGDLDEELRAHLAIAADEGAGMAAAGITQSLEAVRAQRSLPWLGDLLRDLRYGCRMLAAHPGFTTVCVVSLAIGIGANCAVFSFADALILRPLTVPHPAEIVTVGTPDMMGRAIAASYREYLDIRRLKSFDDLAAFTSATVAFSTDPAATPTARIGMLVSENFFDAMAIAPAFGHVFRAEEQQVPGRDAVVILGHEFWTRALHADRSVLGRTVRLNGIAFTVIGVMPEHFTGLDRYTRFEFYAPLMMWPALSPIPGVDPLDARDFRRLTLKGRLKGRDAFAHARSELARLSSDLERAYPATNRNHPFVVRTELQDRFAQSPPNAILTSMLAFLAAGVLFVACANVAGLIVSRAPTRAREIALRLAIGASRSRVVRQLLTESLLIAVIGGALGLGVGYAGVTLFRQFRSPTDLPIAVSFRLDGRALVISMLVATLSALIFGLAPAMRATRADLTAVMKATDAAGYRGRRRWGRSLLVAGQVAMSVVLLAIATFVYGDFQRRLDAGPGFRRDHLLMMWFDPSLVQYTGDNTHRFYERLAEGARNTPGITAVTVTSFVPVDGGAASVRVVPEAFVIPNGDQYVNLWSATVDERFFDVFRVPLLAGRGFTASDTADAPRVAIVNEHFAKRFWPGRSPLGKRFRMNDASGPWVEVVGLAQTTTYSFLLESPIEFVYFPARQRPQPRMALVVETAGDPSALASPMRDLVRRIDAGQPIYNLRSMEQTYDLRVVSILTVIIRFVGAMGVMGLALAVVGLYGLVSYAASRRTKEIGIRIAIGAERRDVLRLVIGQGVTLAIAGLAAGLLASVGAGQAMKAAFPIGDGGLRSVGPAAFALVGSIVLIVTLVAAYLPARRAARINPTDALRHD